ncbi:hypothetical protein WD019_15280 [Fictibacillus sp. Mic-4]|uniref:hypothetical protein n=1 Tax=Fictibacillus sp. Mic-4 TaxID=3132826 RepID=UPI003CF434DB
MDKFLFGKILGEIYRIQNRNGYCPVSEGRIYGLLNGIETAIDEEISDLDPITKEELRAAADILNKYWKDPADLKEVTGYYDLEDEFEAAGLDRGKMIKILTYFNSNRQFTELISKFDSSNSPTECRTFELYDYNK